MKKKLVALFLITLIVFQVSFGTIPMKVSAETLNDAYIESVTVNAGVIAPNFEPETRGYALILPQNSTSVTFTAIPRDPESQMRIRINEGFESDLISGVNSELAVQSGDVITITCIALDGTERKYTFSVAIEEMRQVDLEIGQSELNWATIIGSKDYGVNVNPMFIQTVDGGVLAAETMQPVKVPEDYGYNGHTNVIQLVKTNSQGAREWSRFLPGLGFTSIQDVKQTSDGGYVVLGVTSITPTGDPNIPSHIYLARLDANGNVLWEKTDGEGLTAQKVLVEADGGFFIIANSSSRTEIIKTDSTGGILWGTFVSGVKGTDIKATSDGGYIIIGQDTNYKSFLVKLDHIAQESWRLQLNYEDFTIYSVIEDTDGYVFLGFDNWDYEAVIGKTQGLGSINNPPTLMWTNPIDPLNGFDPEGSQSLVKGFNGNYYIVGTRFVNFNNQDIVLYEIDPSGVVIEDSTKILSGSSNARDLGFAIFQNSSGNFIIGGTTGSYDSTNYLFLLNLIGEPIPSYTVTFDTTGGSTVSSQTVVSGGFINEPPNPTKENHTFGGWYKEVDLTTEWDFVMETVTEDMILYAKWIASEDPNPIPGGLAINLTATPTSTTNQLVTITATVTDEVGVEVVKWANGNQNVAFFATNGTTFTNSFTINSNGTYTVYARNSEGHEAVQTITINNISQTKYINGGSLMLFKDTLTGHLRLYFAE